MQLMDMPSNLRHLFYEKGYSVLDDIPPDVVEDVLKVEDEKATAQMNQIRRARDGFRKMRERWREENERLRQERLEQNE